MIKKLLANKKILAVLIIVIVIILGIVIAIGTNRDATDSKKPGLNLDVDNEKNDSSDKEDIYDGDGLEIKDEVDGAVDSVDVSGDWGETPDEGNNKEQSNKTDNVDKNDSDSKNDKNEDKDEGESDENILIDDKIWGEPS